ncbi:MAG: hypothetical protein ACRDJW_15845 [Thermomicrobiales bacterium]
MTDYLLVMAMMAIALIAVLIAFILDHDDEPEATEESPRDPRASTPPTIEPNQTLDGHGSRTDTTEQSG